MTTRYTSEGPTTIAFENGMGSMGRTVEMHPAMLLDPTGLDWLRAAWLLAPTLFESRLVVTSLFDGEHSDGSFHYAGFGGDVRWTLARPGGVWVDGPMRTSPAGLVERQRVIAAPWANRCLLALRGRWQVMIKNDHIHFERDPR